MCSWDVSRSPKFCPKLHEENRVFPAEDSALHLDGDLLSYLIHSEWQVAMISLRFMNKTVGTIVDGRVVPLKHWYQNYSDKLSTIMLVRRGRWGAEMTAIPVGISSFITATNLTTAVVWLSEYVKVLYILWCVLLPSEIFSTGLGDRTGPNISDRSLSSTLGLWPICALFGIFRKWCISSFFRDCFLISFFTRLGY